MRHINGVYTQHYNRLKKTDGPLFRGRYKAINIQASSYLTEVSRYIHRNPIDMKRPLVTTLSDYPWSSYPAYLNKTSLPDFLYRHDIYAEVSGQRPTQRYRHFVERGVDNQTSQFYQRDYWPAVRGDEDFTSNAHLHAKNNSREISRKDADDIIDINTIINTVMTYYNCTRAEVIKAKRGRGKKNLPRWVAMGLCQDHSGEKLREIARCFNVKHYSTVSVTIARLRRLMREDGGLANEYNSISQDLTP